VDRRGFLRSLLGVAAITALPSEVWPFRKIFLPPAPVIVAPTLLDIAAIQAIELETFAKEIPDLFYKDTSLYEYFKGGKTLNATSRLIRFPARQMA
jgi:hypothetical protein